MEDKNMKKTLVVATGALGVVAHDVLQIMKTTGMSVTESAKELAKRTKRECVSGFWRGYLLSK